MRRYTHDKPRKELTEAHAKFLERTSSPLAPFARHVINNRQFEKMARTVGDRSVTRTTTSSTTRTRPTMTATQAKRQLDITAEIIRRDQQRQQARLAPRPRIRTTTGQMIRPR